MIASKLLQRNIAAGLFGAGLIAILNFVVTPFQVKILGLEAFGIIGFIATLQIAFTAFDFGLSATLTRELAADLSPQKIASGRLVNTALTFYWGSALFVGVLLFLAAGPISRLWFNAERLDADVIRSSFQVVAVYLALRWPVALYTGLLAGFQQLTTANSLKVVTSALRLLGGIVVLLIWHSLESFLIWTSLAALVEVYAYHRVCRQRYPALALRPVIDRDAIARVWRFSFTMNALAIVAVIVVQLDRLFISRLLTLEMLGIYNLAYTLASAIALIIAAVSSAVLPSMAAAYGTSDRAALTERYFAADRVMLFLVGGAAFVLVNHGQLLMTLWVSADAAGAAYVPLALISIGFWLNSINANAYNIAVAAGRPGRLLKVNLWAIIPYAVLLHVLITRFGLTGAAVAGLILNIFYSIIVLPHVHRDMLAMTSWRWLVQIVLPYLVIGALAFPVLAYLETAGGWTGTTAQLVGLAVSCLAYAALAGYWFFGRRQGSGNLAQL
jgi:O-antigen/teichoic acid export membrane protein